jgi:hypothetical protein
MSSFNEARLYMNNHLPYGRGVVSAVKDATLNVNIKTCALIEAGAGTTCPCYMSLDGRRPLGYESEAAMTAPIRLKKPDQKTD